MMSTEQANDWIGLDFHKGRKSVSFPESAPSERDGLRVWPRVKFRPGLPVNLGRPVADILFLLIGEHACLRI